ncbi:MAG: hypothetical protein ACRCZW_15225 [Lactobacillaceae bacterium]
METDLFNVFKRAVNANLYQVINTDTSILLKENDYSFKLKVPALDSNTITLRLEDMKEKANYLSGGQRAAGKDYDLAIISSNCVYQIEMKRGKKIGNQHPDVQLNHGEKWLKHLLEMSSDIASHQIEHKVDIYLYLPTKQKPSKVRQPYSVYFSPNKAHVTVEVSSPEITEINLNSLFRQIRNNSEFVKELW